MARTRLLLLLRSSELPPATVSDAEVLLRRSCCQQRRLAADGLEAGLEMRRRLRGSWGFVGARVAAGEGLGALGAVLRLRLLVGVAAPGLAAEDARVLAVCRESEGRMRKCEGKNLKIELSL